MIRLSILAVGGAMVAVPASLAPSPDAPATVDGELFAVAERGLYAVALGELGVRKATDPALKRFSTAMVSEHARFNRALADVAEAKGIALPRSVGPGSQFTLHILDDLCGTEFDRCYATTQLVAHRSDVAAFEAESERGRDGPIRDLAATALPRIRMLLDMIRPIAMSYEGDLDSTAM